MSGFFQKKTYYSTKYKVGYICWLLKVEFVEKYGLRGTRISIIPLRTFVYDFASTNIHRERNCVHSKVNFMKSNSDFEAQTL